ncbi:MAG: large subunit ribosomal protein [Candidatus Atribacteria bacterium]|nr:large subunit ribosomal protein [Candidatus Atribacteria bacterium]
MLAIIEDSGRQFAVEEGQVIALNGWRKEGTEAVFDRVLLVKDQDKVATGTPYLTGAKVIGKVVKLKKGKKINVFKYKPKKNYRRRQGYRPLITEVKIQTIEYQGNGGETVGS